ncbi:hypothetical protein L7F22_013277 [Adiantum nelumboides]|nr:hypothetical protein [Adiantum nelumboides]
MRPVYCGSRVKLVAERKSLEVELVMASVIFAYRRFHHYLLPRPFVFLTNYTFLPQLINGTNMSNVVKKWIIELQEFEFSFLVEDSTRATLADLLNYKENPLVKEEMVRKEELYRVLEENHEGACGGHFALKITMHKKKFVYDEICCKFGVPLELLLVDKGPKFRAKLLDFLCAKMKIRHQHTTPYYPQCNGLNERFNGELVQILSKVTEHQGKNWDLELPSALWAYRTLVKTTTGFTPFHLIYEKEALVPMEVDIPAVNMLRKLLGQFSDAFKERLLQLQKVQLCRMSALEHYGQMQDKALEKINEKVKIKGIKKHDLVLHYNNKLEKTFQKKFQLKWEGPFKVVECFLNGTYQLAHLDGILHKSRKKGLHLKLYHTRSMMVEQDELSAEQQVMSVEMRRPVTR